jgi:hypothetical protein
MYSIRCRSSHGIALPLIMLMLPGGRARNAIVVLSRALLHTHRKCYARGPDVGSVSFHVYNAMWPFFPLGGGTHYPLAEMGLEACPPLIFVGFPGNLLIPGNLLKYGVGYANSGAI